MRVGRRPAKEMARAIPTGRTAPAAGQMIGIRLIGRKNSRELKPALIDYLHTREGWSLLFIFIGVDKFKPHPAAAIAAIGIVIRPVVEPVG